MGYTQEQFFERWSLIRRKGERHFVLTRGVLMWGVPLGVTLGLINLHHLSGLDFGIFMIIQLGVSCIIGLPYGWIMWEKGERRYREIVENRPKS